MSSIVTPFGGSNGGGIKKPKLIKREEFSITNDQTRTYSETFNNGGFVVITGTDGFLFNSTQYISDRGKTEDLNSFKIIELKIDNIKIPLTVGSAAYGITAGSALQEAPVFTDQNYTGTIRISTNPATLRPIRCISRYIIPIKQNINLTYGIKQSGTGYFIFYKFEYQE